VQTQLSSEFKDHKGAQAAASILRKCVHCGFCNATCPTYQLLGDELDGPRGRIYLIKQMLEGGEVSSATQAHLDRCLTCLNCESTCPSGVKYGQLVEIGRQLVDERVPRRGGQRISRWLLKEGLTSGLFAVAARLGRAVRPLLPRRLGDKLPPLRSRAASSDPAIRTDGGKVVLLRGCVQPALLPHVDRATRRVLELAGFEVVELQGTGCCGALRSHLSDLAGGRNDMRRNLDALLPELDDPKLRGIVSSATACALTVKQYAHALADDPAYAAKAARVSGLARDLSEVLPEIVTAIGPRVRAGGHRVAYHPPCTLQHGQKLRGGVETQLRRLGIEVKLASDAHLCCGSAGAYSMLQPEISEELRARKLQQLNELGAQCLISGNVGCITHLQAGTDVPVKHWIELLDEVVS
jgi:glycolate oxidase iron-sulfur subunit